MPAAVVAGEGRDRRRQVVGLRRVPHRVESGAGEIESGEDLPVGQHHPGVGSGLRDHVLLGRGPRRRAEEDETQERGNCAPAIHCGAAPSAVRQARRREAAYNPPPIAAIAPPISRKQIRPERGFGMIASNATNPP